MTTLDDILKPQSERGRSRLNPQGNANATESGGEEIVKPAETTTAPQQQSERGRSRLNPQGNANATESGGERSLSTATTVTAPVAEKPTVTAKPGLADLIKKLDSYTPPTPEQLEKEKKKQRRRQVIAAIGDGISALSNLYFTTQGAPNMYDGKNTMTERVKANYDKLRTERDKKNAEHFNNMLKIYQLEDIAAKDEREWQRKLGLDEEARQRYRNEQIEKKEKNELERKFKLDQLSKLEYEVQKAEIEAKYADKVQQSIIDRNRNSGRKAEYVSYDKDGNEHYFFTEGAAEAFARQNGTWVEDEYESSETSSESEVNRKGEVIPSKTTTKTTTKTRNGRSVKPEKKTGKGAMPGVTNKKMPGVK